MKVALITGTRPQIIKSVPLIKELLKHDEIELKFIHTGQHYDYNMFKGFIKEFELPQPFNISKMDNNDYSFATTVARLLRLWEIECERPDLIIVPGDTDSAFAAAYAASTCDIPLAHLESGVREYDMTMREERNRRMIDHIASLLLVPTQTAWSNLVRENVLGKMLLCGDTNYDLFMQRGHIFLSEALTHLIAEQYGITEQYGILTIHRAANVDNWKQLYSILRQIIKTGKRFIWPIHPRTKKIVTEYLTDVIKDSNIDLIDPVPYDIMMNLVSNASVVVTDSGGLQKESYFALTPCITLRDVTAWPETTEYDNANFLLGDDYIAEQMDIQWGRDLFCSMDVFGDGGAAEKIVDYILKYSIEVPRKFHM